MITDLAVEMHLVGGVSTDLLMEGCRAIAQEVDRQQVIRFQLSEVAHLPGALLALRKGRELPPVRPAEEFLPSMRAVDVVLVGTFL